MVSIALPIVVAIIGVIGTLASPLMSPLASTINSQILGRPDIDINLTPSGNDIHNASIVLTNHGNAPATNLTLIVQAPKKISESPEVILNTTNIKYLKYGQSSLKMHVPKFVNGPGSLIELRTLIDSTGKNGSNQYIARAIYDQGSTLSRMPQTLVNILSQTWGGITGLIVSIVSYLVILVVIAFYVRKRRKLHKGKPVNNVMLDMIKTRKILKKSRTFEAILDTHPLFDTMEALSVLGYDLSDYVQIEDFYEKVGSRNEYVTTNKIKDTIKLKKLNNACLLLADTALKNIDWKKYL